MSDRSDFLHSSCLQRLARFSGSQIRPACRIYGKSKPVQSAILNLWPKSVLSRSMRGWALPVATLQLCAEFPVSLARSWKLGVRRSSLPGCYGPVRPVTAKKLNEIRTRKICRDGNDHPAADRAPALRHSKGREEGRRMCVRVVQGRDCEPAGG